MWFSKTLVGLFVALIALLKCYASDDNTATYDYIILGGGTSGLVIANRLSELPNVSVLVIEAGTSVFNNTNVTSTAYLGTLPVGTSVDWQYRTVNQTYADNRQHILDAGKAIGGTSTINC